MIVVGISALYHDAACAILVDGRLAAAAQEERFTRRRFDPSIPANAMRHCLHELGLDISQIDHLAYYEDPTLRLSRQLWSGLPEFPLTSPGRLLHLDADRPYRVIRDMLGYDGPVTTVTHHEAHAASAFYCSGFPESAVLTADAVGEWATTSYGIGDADGVRLLEEVDFPHSLGLLYSTVTSYLGFAVNSDEYKVMGLAPYGRPRHRERILELVRSGPGGRFELNQDYFDFVQAPPMYTQRLVDLLGAAPREPDGPVDAFHEDVAASLQVVTEELLLEKVRHLHDLTGCDRLSYAGGVALNCVANSRIRAEGPFREMFVQPAAGDAGGAVGAAAVAHHRLTGSFRPERLRDARLGPSIASDTLTACFRDAGVAHDDFTGRLPELVARTAGLLADGKVVGWCQGRMEFGPRALGARSILGDPRDPGMRDRINGLVKKRESFRPFAPAVVAERCAEFFDISHDSPFMLETVPVRDPLALPAVTHVDGSARLQTVEADVDARFHALLTEFGNLTGYPILLNTSFNMRGEPIVLDAADALLCFVRSGLDVLVVGDLLLLREDIPARWEILASAGGPEPARGVTGAVYTFV